MANLHPSSSQPPQTLFLFSLQKKLQISGASVNGKTNSSEGGPFFIPGATLATLLMLSALHARRLYEDRKMEEARVRGVEVEFSPDIKATFLGLLPLRSISRIWGLATSVEYPVWLRPYIYKAWARAFHPNLEEAALPLEQYASLRDFFVRTLKEGSRPVDPDPHCLVSPVDGTILIGELKPGAMIQQIKGASYSASSLLGASSFLSIVQDNVDEETVELENTTEKATKKSWWRLSLASPKVRDPTPVSSTMKGVFYCVIYLKPGDYHRVHSPVNWNVFSSSTMKGVFYCVIYLKPGDYHRVHYHVNWNVLIRRHFPSLISSGRLYPVNERARRTTKNLYVENEKVVLEGRWKEGFMALAAVGATTIGSIQLLIEPELKTNRREKLLYSEPPRKRVYEPKGVMLNKGLEVATFNMGSTVVLVFQSPVSKPSSNEYGCEFIFCVKRGDTIHMEALGRWNTS